MKEQGFPFSQGASDQAQGIAAGVHAALGEEIPHQLDLGHLFGEVARLDAEVERTAYKTIREEAERGRVLDSAQRERVIVSRIEAWEQAPQKMEEAISRSEDFHSLAGELSGLFPPVSPQGAPRSLTAVQGDWKRFWPCWRRSLGPKSRNSASAWPTSRRACWSSGRTGKGA
ncbi:MAG TPA: hypothetical protein EYP17_06145 [Candidatus Latescibacteria bacterium]|nr:hypothetical protein [Candidatus Latescibacterota bacterium]